MSNDITISNTLPAQILALQHSTLDQAMSLCERAHGVAIPPATIDEAGCRSALAAASAIYDQINALAKELEAARMDRGREISALKTQLDAAVKAAVMPLEDQRAKLGAKLLQAQRDLARVIEEKRHAAERERVRIEAERRAAAEAAEQARLEAERAAAAAAEAARRAQEQAAVAAAEAATTGEDPLPDDDALTAATIAAQAASDAAAKAAEARAAAVERVFDATPAPYVAPAPKSSVKARIDHSLVIDDLALVPREVAGVPLWKFDEAAALRLLKSGAKIPGLSLLATETTSAKGRAGAGAFAV